MTEVTAGAFRTVARADMITEGAVVPVYLSDAKLRISITRVGGDLYAFDDLCTCADDRCPLSGGLITGPVIMCQCHGSEFDVTTGVVKRGPASRQLTVYALKVIDGDVRLQV
ncbi:Rieske 2Fe-2S domain-containing protein [Streptomyces sp. NPDC005385]|uniref:Rieske (2Fe-2S) protein n=1 Tax=Streptomyces sp. NPDC005385 TaxID=3157039 RepID=UPI0033A5006F